MTSAFLVMSLGSFAMVAALSRRVATSGWSRAGLALLSVWAIALILAAVFPIDLEDAPETTQGRIHRMVGPVAFSSLTLGLLFLSRAFGRDERWQPWDRTAVVLSSLVLAEFVIGIFLIVRQSPFAGLGQRVLLATVVAWFIATALRIRSLPVSHPASGEPGA